jgi:hypothetical protein
LTNYIELKLKAESKKLKAKTHRSLKKFSTLSRKLKLTVLQKKLSALSFLLSASFVTKTSTNYQSRQFFR